MAEPIGILAIKVLQGKLLRNTEFFGQMDPFVQVDYRGKTFKTTALQEAGKNPIWNEILAIPIYSMDEEFKITCYDEDLLMDDLVGSAMFNTS